MAVATVCTVAPFASGAGRDEQRIRQLIGGRAPLPPVAPVNTSDAGWQSPWSSAAPRATRIGEGSWNTYAAPHALRVGSDVFVGWIDERGAIRVGRLSEATGAAEDVVVGATGQRDDHNSPALSADSHGRITVFWSRHNGRHLWYRRQSAPGRIDAWEKPREVGTNTDGRWGFTYPQPASTRSRLWLMWRGGDFQPAVSWARPPRGNRTPRFTRARSLISVPGERPYFRLASDPDGISPDIHVVYTEAAPNRRATGVYHVRIRPSGVWSSDGQTRRARLKDLPITPDAGDRIDTGAGPSVSSLVLDVMVDSDGRTRVLLVAQVYFAR